MGVLRTNNNESINDQARKYYEQLKKDNWNGTARDQYTVSNGRTGRERHEFGANILSGIALLGRFRQSYPKVLTLAAYRVAPVINTTKEGKAAQTALQAARTARSIASLGIKSFRTYADRGLRVKNEIRKKYDLDYDRDRSYGRFLLQEFKSEEYEDLIPVKFFHPDTNKMIQVRGIISGITDSINPNWNSSTYTGRPDEIVNYTGFTREFNFSLKLAATNPDSIRPMWATINELSKFVLPAVDTVKTRFHGKLCKVTVGNMLERELCAMTSFTITPDENSYWEVLDPDKDYPSLTLRAPGNIIKRTANLGKRAIQRVRPRKRFVMPRICDIGISLKVLHNKLPGEGGANLYRIGKAKYDGEGGLLGSIRDLLRGD